MMRAETNASILGEAEGKTAIVVVNRLRIVRPLHPNFVNCWLPTGIDQSWLSSPALEDSQISYNHVDYIAPGCLTLKR